MIESINQSINLSINQSHNQSASPSINETASQSTNQSIKQTANQLINQSIGHTATAMMSVSPTVTCVVSPNSAFIAFTFSLLNNWRCNSYSMNGRICNVKKTSHLYSADYPGAYFRDNFANARIKPREMFTSCKLGCSQAVAIAKLKRNPSKFPFRWNREINCPPK